VGSAVATTGATFAVITSISDDTVYNFYANATDVSGNVGVCSTTTLSFTEDSGAPATPTITATNPVSPSNVNNPIVTGTGTPNEIIKLYSNSTCTTQIGTGTIDGSGNFSVTVNFTSNTTNSIYAKSMDAANNSSGCTATPTTYVEDSAAPTLTVSPIAPASPANNNNPVISGTSEIGASIGLYSNNTCTTSLNTTTADGAGAFAFNLTITDNTTNSYYLQAQDAIGNKSNCSSVVTYVEDSTAPALPTFTASSPTSPANNNTPTVSGGAEANSTVTVYTDSGCTTLAHTVAANGSGVFSFVASVTDNTSTTYYAKAADAAGNISACSTSNLTFTEDSIAPAMPVVLTTNPVSPSGNNNPQVTGTADANSTVRLYSNNTCTTQIGSGTATGGGTFSVTATVANNSSTDIYARAVDAATNQGPCSSTFVTYVEDSTPPAMPTVDSITPVSPSNINTPAVAGTAEPNITVRLYSNNTCTTQIGSGTADGAGNYSINATVPSDAVTTIYAAAIDTSNNPSSCSTTFISYTEDSTPPAAPSLVSVNPVSPANNNNPIVSGTAVANTTVTIYSNISCTTLVGTTTADGSGNFTYNAAVTDNSTNNFFAKASDAAGNTSICSAGLTYIEDSLAPASPVFTGTTPLSPSDNNDPTINGTIEANAGIQLYSDSSCTVAVGAPTSAPAGSFSIPVNVADNTTTSFYARVADVAGNISNCSGVSQIYQNYAIATGVAVLTGTETNDTVAPTNLNQTTAFSMAWSSSNYHSTYFDHSTTVNNHQLKVKVAGRYRVSLTLPHTAATANTSLRANIRVNGANISTGRGDSYIKNTGGHREASINLSILLPSLLVDDLIDVTVIRDGAAATVTTIGTATLNVEYMDVSKPLFYATATQTTNSTNLNQGTAYPMQWSNVIIDSNYSHSNITNPQNVTITTAGSYLVYFNVPLNGAVTNAAVKATLKKNGVAVPGAVAKQGYISNLGAQINSTLSWSGILTGIAANDIITLDVQQEAAAGTITVTAAYAASLLIEALPSNAGVFAGRGTTLTTNTNWNNAAAQSFKATTADLYDAAVYTHSTVTNSHQVTVDAAGDYLVIFSSSVNNAVTNANYRVTLQVNGVDVTGAYVASNYISNLGGHTESSGSMVYHLRGLNANDIVSITSIVEAATGTLSSDTDAHLVLIQKPLALTP
jgi:hypothetical protein